jgi:transcriptional regulator with XRE-family HTH domain
MTAPGSDWLTVDVSQPSDPTLGTSTLSIDVLWRRALGRQLRELRLARGERLHDTAARAGISPQYLSEIERGRKDASSEMIAAVIGALGSTLADVLVRVADGLTSSRVEVIALRSSISLVSPTITSRSDLRAVNDPVLSLAA